MRINQWCVPTSQSQDPFGAAMRVVVRPQCGPILITQKHRDGVISSTS
jgi:hypothetical protein